MPQAQTSSIKTRIVASAAVLLCCGTASFAYGVMTESSIFVHSVLFVLAGLGGAFLLWTVHAHMMRPLAALSGYAKEISAGKGERATCPGWAMPAEYSALRDAMCLMVEHLDGAIAAAREKEAALFERRREALGIVRLLPAIENC